MIKLGLLCAVMLSCSLKAMPTLYMGILYYSIIMIMKKEISAVLACPSINRQVSGPHYHLPDWWMSLPVPSSPLPSSPRSVGLLWEYIRSWSAVQEVSDPVSATWFGIEASGHNHTPDICLINTIVIHM